MSLRLRRGPSTDRISIVFQAGELVYDTTEKRLYVGDDLTQGGVPVSDLLGDLSPQLGGDLDLNGEDIIGFGNINIDGDITATGTLTIPSIITDVTGSIFGDDSTPLVDGANSKLVLENNSLSDLGDVTAPTEDKQILEWNSLTNTWDSKNFNLNDYVFNSSEGSYLRFNGTSWVASYLNDSVNSQNGRILVNAETEVLYLGANSLADIGDVFLPGTINHGSILKYNSTTENWEADSSGLVGNLNDLSDVNNTAIPTLGDVLTWDGQEWNFSQPKETTNVVGSVFGDDSTILVDGIQNKINLSNNNLSDLYDVELYNTPGIGDILRWNGFRWGPTNNLQDFRGNFQGSVFADDSTLLVDGITGELYANAITVTDIYADTPETNFKSTVASHRHVNIFSIDLGTDDTHEPVINCFRESPDPATRVNHVHGGFTFKGKNASTGSVSNFGYVLGTGKRIIFASNENGVFDNQHSMAFEERKFGVGTRHPSYTLDIQGEGVFTNYLRPGVFADATARDATITVPIEGSMVFLQDTQKMQVYVLDTGLAGGGLANSTPGWHNMY